MSDFDDVVYVETDDKPVGPSVAPSGDHPAKIISAESSAQDYVGKDLTLTLKEVENNWTDNEGNERTGSKNKVLRYLPADTGGMSPPPAAVPPDLG